MTKGRALRCPAITYGARMSELINMSKGDETIAVHPSCVSAHERVGWASLGAAALQEEEAGLHIAKGPGGRFFVKRGKETVSGAYVDRSDAEAAMTNKG